MSEAARAATQAAQARVSSTTTLTTKVDTLQTKLSNDNSIGAKTKAAQQALSEKYGIPTFDTKGFISTVPTTRPLDTSINVGTGALTANAYNQSLTYLIQQAQAPINGGVGGFIDTIGRGISGVIDYFFPKTDVSDLTDEQKAKIKDFDTQIESLTKQREAFLAQAGLNSEYAIRAGNLSQKIDELEKGKNDVLRRYRLSNELLKEIKSQIEVLTNLSKTGVVTAALKTTIDEEIQKASALIETKLRENLDITQETITQLQKAMLAAIEIKKIPIKEEQEQIQQKIQDDFDLWKTIQNMGKPSVQDKIRDYIDDYRAQRGAIDILITTGEFKATGVSK